MDDYIKMKDLNHIEKQPKNEDSLIIIHKKWKYTIKEKLYFVEFL